MAKQVWEMTRDNLAWHYNPVHDSDFFIRADLTARGMPGRFEQFWAKRENDRVFRICCVPFFTYGIALGDTVETDDEFTFLRVVTKGGHKTLRIAVASKIDQARIHSVLMEWVEQSGLPYEWYSNGYVAVDLPPDVDDVKNKSVLDELQRNEDIAIEIVE